MLHYSASIMTGYRPAISIIVMLFLLLSVAQCSDPTSSGSGTLRIRLTDAPFPYRFVESVNLTISKVDIRPTGSLGFQSISSNQGTFDLLTLQGGKTDTLGVKRLPSSFYDAIRMSVIDVSVVVTDGRILTAVISDSIQANGIVALLVPNTQVKENQTTDLIVDFNLSGPLIAQGDPTTSIGISGFSFRPAVRVVDLVTVGQLTGLVKHNNRTPSNTTDDVPMRGLPIHVIQAGTTDTISVVTDEMGEYTALFLTAGTYSITVSPTDSTLGWNIPDVVVTTANPTRQDALMSRQ